MLRSIHEKLALFAAALSLAPSLAPAYADFAHGVPQGPIRVIHEGPGGQFGPPRIPGHVYTPPPARDDDDDIEVSRVMNQVMGGRACERAGDVLREMADLLLKTANFTARPDSHPPTLIIVRRGEGEEQARNRWSGHLNSAHFWQIVWERLAQMYRECDKGCFDDGVAVGQLSATGYCSASIAVGGLGAPGLEAQKPLPLCQNETFVGCLSGYDRAAASYAGCSAYTSGGYLRIFDQSKSQDCHIAP
jgi:hypothetical protein